MQILQDCLIRINLQWNRCRGQCYDGASNKAGSRNGVATHILTRETRALYTHCYRHDLNFAMCDIIEQCKLTRDAIDVTHEISKLVKFSPKQNAQFDQLTQSCRQISQASGYVVPQAGLCEQNLTERTG